MKKEQIITQETLEYIAILSKLELSEEEKEQTKADMEQMLTYFQCLNAMDTRDVEPMSHVQPSCSHLREDEVTNTNHREAMLANAPERKRECFLVPKTIEQE